MEYIVPHTNKLPSRSHYPDSLQQDRYDRIENK